MCHYFPVTFSSICRTRAATSFSSRVASVVPVRSSLRQRRFPVRLLGRISMASRTVLFGVMPVAFVAGGALARSHGPDVLFVVSATVGLVTTAWMAATGLGRLRA